MDQKQTQLDIIIKSKDDPTPALKLDKKDVTYSTLKTFIILEEATSNKKTGVVIHTELPTGKHILINTTSTLFRSMSHALNGAEQRFESGAPTISEQPVEVTINQLIQMNKDQMDTSLISDGENTFGEIYDLFELIRSKLLDRSESGSVELSIIQRIEKILNK